MQAVRTMKRSVKTFPVWRHKDEQDSRDDRMLAVRTMKRLGKIVLAWRHKDELDSGDVSDAGRQDNEEVS